MLALSMPHSAEPSLISLLLVFAGGALGVVLAAAMIRAGITALLEPRGHWLDPWRRVWFHPERELGHLVEALLIVAFVASFARHYALPLWATAALAGLWALHLPSDSWSWLRARRHPPTTRQLHERGFRLLDLGPLWLRALIAGAALGLYLLPPLRPFFDRLMSVILLTLARWVS